MPTVKFIIYCIYSTYESLCLHSHGNLVEKICLTCMFLDYGRKHGINPAEAGRAWTLHTGSLGEATMSYIPCQYIIPVNEKEKEEMFHWNLVYNFIFFFCLWS